MRALVKYLDGIGDAEIVGLNIPNGIPLVYELDDALKPIRSYYLGDAEAAAKAAAAVANQASGATLGARRRRGVGVDAERGGDVGAQQRGELAPVDAAPTRRGGRNVSADAHAVRRTTSARGCAAGSSRRRTRPLR